MESVTQTPLADCQQQLDLLRHRARHASSYLERKSILLQISLLCRSVEQPWSEASDSPAR